MLVTGRKTEVGNFATRILFVIHGTKIFTVRG